MHLCLKTHISDALMRVVRYNTGIIVAALCMKLTHILSTSEKGLYSKTLPAWHEYDRYF